MSGWMGIPWQKDRTWVGSSGWGAGLSPSLNLVFNSTPIDPRITFTRASSGTYYDGSTVMAEQNLLTYSQDFTNAAWTKGSATITANSTAAPDGTSTASTLTFSGTSTVNNRIYSTSTYTATAGGNYTKSLYVKYLSQQYIQIYGLAGVNYVYINVDLIGGTITASGGTGVSSSITNVGNSWFRVTLTESNAAGGVDGFYVAAIDTGAAAYQSTSTSTNSFYLWGAQLEQRSSATVYTPTTSAPITNFIPVMQSAANDTPRIDTDVRPNFNGTGTVSSNTIVLPVAFADGSVPYPKDGWYNGQSITVAGSPFTVSGYVASTLTLTLSGSPTAGSQVFSLGNPNQNQKLGLLKEESRTNLLTYSSQFDNAIYIKAQGTILPLADIAPDGTLTAQKFTETTATNIHNIYQAVTVTNTTVYTWSVFIKPAGRSIIRLNCQATAVIFTDEIDLINQTSTTRFGSGTSTITPVGNGWYRVAATATSTGAGTGYWQIDLCNVAGNTNYTGDGYSGILIWNAQLEPGSFSTSSIPTVASQVTRAADSVSMTGTNFSSWYNSIKGSIVAQATNLNIGNFYAVQIDDGTANNRISVVSNSAGSTQAILTGSVSQAALAVGGAPFGDPNKIGISWGAAGSAGALNGGTVQTGAAMAVPTVTTLRLGQDSTGANSSGWIKSFAYYPLVLQNTQLQNLTKL